MKIERINLSQIVSLLLLVIAGLVAINLYQKQNKKIDQIRYIQDEEKKKNEILLRIRELKKRTEVYKQRFKQRDRSEIIDTITNLATATGVKIISLKPQEKSQSATKGEIYDKVFFHLSISVNSYHQLGKFISKLENNPIIIIVESLRVREPSSTSAAAQRDESEELKVELIISEVFLKD